MNAEFFIAAVPAILPLISLLSAVFYGYKRANAKAEKDEAAAAWYDTLERIFSHLFWFAVIVLITTSQQDLMTKGFLKVITILEGLLHG